jgi:hypothetical protein
MAWRIDENVICGEVDNRVKGHITGRIWFQGQAEPLVLNLKGNAHADLAGCLLKFKNTRPAIPFRKDATFSTPKTGSSAISPPPAKYASLTCRSTLRWR